MNKNLLPSAALVILLSGLGAGCAGSGKTVDAGSSGGGGSTSSLASQAGAAAATAGNIYTTLGGSSGVQALANSFGAKLALKPSVTKFLDAAALDAAKGGLVNTIMAASGMATPSGAADLASVLSSKGVDAAGVAGVSESLMEAGNELKLGAEQIAALSGVMSSVSKSVLGG